MKKSIIGTVIVVLVVVALFLIDRTSHKVDVDNKQVEQAYIDELSERTLKLAKLLKQNKEFSLNSIKVDTENFPNRVIYVNLVSNNLNDVSDIEKSVREILQSEKAQLLIQKKETFDIIVLNKDGEKIN
ncbi:hypothetical protein [Peribacillus acanthi]|uniref:hypothetical protein n=1 Tax=Peribacillus acanthi TaxID=2171554 RepID=UPI000D3E4B0C|nr:hypothetical protein [Peribacillus acanthi]